MNEVTVRSANTREFWTRERCHVRELVNDPQLQDFSLAEVRVPPGVKTELHKLGVNEWYVIRSGQGRMEVGGQPWLDVAPGNFVAIPAGTSQRIENPGPEDLIFECICLPRFSPDTYESLEDA